MYDDDHVAFLRTAFPEKEWLPEEVDAIKEFVRACVEKEEAGEYDEGPMSKPSKGMMGPDLAIVIGEEPKKKK